MVKKIYSKPAMVVVTLQHRLNILEGSGTRTVSNAGIKGGTEGSAGESRTRESSGVWDEEW